MKAGKAALVSPIIAVLLSLFAAQALAASYTLTINVTGSGSVGRNPTNTSYPAGATVTVTAVPQTGWLFSGWTGDETSGANPLNVLMSSNKTITAHFDVIPSYTLTASVSGAGSVSLAPPGGVYLSNSVVSATATPSPGWFFLYWSGSASGTTNPLGVIIDGNKALTAVFVQMAAIDMPPQDVSVGLNDAASFTVHAVGTPPLSYQWSFNGQPVSGATRSTFNVTNVQPTDEGTYSVLVTNSCGSSSASAWLIITNSCFGTNVVLSPSEAELRNAIAIGGVVRCCFNGAITLSSTIDITHDVTLDAHDRLVVISGNNAVRLFKVNPGVTFAATNVVFAYGRHVGQDGAPAGTQPAQPGMPGEGGAFFIDTGTLQLSSCVLATNSAAGGNGGNGNYNYPLDSGANGTGGPARGGAIYMQGGALLLDSVIVCNNSAVGGLGGTAFYEAFPFPSYGGDALGGAIYVTNGSVAIVNSTLHDNLCRARLGGRDSSARVSSALGGAVLLASGSIIISNSSICTNSASGDSTQATGSYTAVPGSGFGGGLALQGGTVNIIRSRVYANAALGGDRGAGLAPAQGAGGGIFSSASLVADESTFDSNVAASGYGTEAAWGGALYNAGSASLRGCSVISNRVVGAGGGWFEFNGGSAGRDGLGGGIFSAGQVEMTNCTVAVNSAVGGNGSGGAYPGPGYAGGGGFGGGVYNTNGVFLGMNITVATNSVLSGAPAYDATPSVSLGGNVANTNGTLWLANSLLAYAGTNGNAWGAITDGGYNISSDGTANFQSGSSFNFTDPLLLPLANNGGFTPTMALALDSPAVDSGSTTGAPSTDQRGVPRPMGSGVDIGSYELVSSRFVAPILTLTRQGGTLLLSFTAQPNVFYSLQRSPSLNAWIEMEMIGPFLNTTTVTRTISIQPQLSFFRLSLH